MDIEVLELLYNRGRWGTVSNALLKSKNTAQMSSPELSNLCQLSVVVSKAPVVDREKMEFLKVGSHMLFQKFPQHREQ